MSRSQPKHGESASKLFGTISSQMAIALPLPTQLEAEKQVQGKNLHSSGRSRDNSSSLAIILCHCCALASAEATTSHIDSVFYVVRGSNILSSFDSYISR